MNVEDFLSLTYAHKSVLLDIHTCQQLQATIADSVLTFDTVFKLFGAMIQSKGHVDGIKWVHFADSVGYESAIFLIEESSGEWRIISDNVFVLLFLRKGYTKTVWNASQLLLKKR